jgi:hypothetical protein
MAIMRRLKRAQQRHAREPTIFKRRVVAAGTAAVITLGAGFALNKGIAANVPDKHQLPVKQDMDGDFLADREEFAIGYKPFVADQNRNGKLDGLELATRCAAIIAQLPWQDDAAPGATCKWHAPQFGLETCEICGQTVNMGPATIVNPRLGVEVKCPLIAMHYMEHGSFNYAGDVQRGRIDVPALMRALELRFPGEPDEHQMPVAADDLDSDLLTDNEELAAGYNLYNADQDEDLTPDGIELATQCAQVIEALPIHEPNEPGVGELYKASFMQRGIELCEICGESVNMGYWEVINPKLHLSIEVPDIVRHYMLHGSFSYWGNLRGKGRIDVALLARILEMPRRCGDLGTIFAPADLNQDCKIDLADLAKLAENWLNSTDPNLR